MGILKKIIAGIASLFVSPKRGSANAASLYAVLGNIGRTVESELGLSDDSQRVLCRCVVTALLGIVCGMNMLPERDLGDMGKVKKSLRMAASNLLANEEMIDMIYADYRENTERPATPFGTPRPASVRVLPKSEMVTVISRLASIG